MQEIYPRAKRHPYYIVSTPYTRMSAGIKVLHLLCHALNTRGENAFITTAQTNPDLLTPPLTDEIIERHFAEGLAPIAIYPEVIIGNPAGAPVVVRYILNFPGLLGGSKTFDSSEICYGYSFELLRNLDERFHNNVLFLPASDTSIYFPPAEGFSRSGSCFYAGKYQAAHHETLFEITNGSTEIHGPLSPHRSQSPQEIAELFRASELFYCYENSALAIEAALCGCPVVFLPNRHLTSSIGGTELGNAGMAWGSDPAEVARAKATVSEFPENYSKLVERFWTQLDEFRETTMAVARRSNYATKYLPTHISVQDEVGSEMRVPKSQTGKVIVLLLLIVRIIQVTGFFGTIRDFSQCLVKKGLKGLKGHIKMLYYAHFDWIRSRLI